MNRRQALALIGASTTLSIPSLASAPRSDAASALAGSVFSPIAFGAKADGKTLDSPAINAAIDACTRAGGGVVYCAPGRYLCGTVVMKSNVTLYLEAGCVILGSTDVAQYTPQPGPDPKGDAGQGHLIYARDAVNVSIIGPGTIDGQGRTFWTPANRAPVADSLQWTDARHLDWKPKARISPMVELVNCTNLRLESVELTGASGWTLRPINCQRVFIEGIIIRNPAIGPNTDGIDLTSCQDVVISNCLIDTGDDAICLKSENPYGQGPQLSKNIAITNCIITSSTNGFKIGTATQGGFENITFSNSTIVNSTPDLAARMVAGIAIEMVDGGWVDGIVISAIQIQNARSPIFIRRGDRSRPFPAENARLRGVLIDGVQATGAILTSSITGLPGMEVQDVRLSNIHVDTVMPGKPEWLSKNVPEVPAAYPQSRMFGWLPASGLYCRHVRGLSLKDVSFTAPAEERRSTLIFDDVETLNVTGFRTSTPAGKAPPIVLRDTREAWISACASPAGSPTFARVEGPRTAKILVSGCDFREAVTMADLASEVPGTAVHGEGNILGR